MTYPKGHRLDTAWLDRALYPVSEPVRPRFQDLDPLNHVNNVAMAAMFEDARVRFNHPMREHFQTDTVRTMVAGQTLNYVNESHLRPELMFHLGVGHMGRSSWVGSPVTTMRDRAPIRVRNIFIWAVVVFWASSRMMKALLRVRPRM